MKIITVFLISVIHYFLFSFYEIQKLLIVSYSITVQ